MNTVIQTPANDLDNSLAFYTKLSFSIVSKQNPLIVSDGKANIEINPDKYTRPSIKLYNTDWQSTVNQLKHSTNVIDIDDGYLLSDPAGVWVYLIENKQLPEASPTVSPSTLGNFMGVSIETIEMKQSLKTWELLGFTQTMGAIEQGWVCLANKGKMAISLMKPLSCPHLFFNPSLTYFNGKNNLQIIEKIRKLRIPITEEITHFNKEGLVDNIIIRDPAGLGFFIFND